LFWISGVNLEILSISIDNEALKRLNEIQKMLGFKSRSKMLRNAILGMAKEYEVLETLKGKVESVFVMTYSDSKKNNVSDILHEFEDAIKTELHQHNSGTCIDVLNINADAKTVRKIFSALKRSKSVNSVTYTIIRKTGNGRK
jgi:metal-responsive CopG/Arc/MetJ family transcriptional regulator